MNSAAAVAVAAIGLMVFAVGGLYVLDATAQDSRHAITVDNETFEPVGGSVVELNNSELARADYDESVDVYGENDQPIPSSGNYSWNSTDGTLFVEDNSTLDNQSVASITYGYVGQTARQTAVTNVWIDSQRLIRLVVLIGGVALLLTGLAAAGAMT